MASRTQNSDYNEDVTEHDDRFSSLGIDPLEKPEKLLCCDFDTLIYWTLVEYNEDKSKKELTLEDLPFLEGKLNELILGIFNKIEKYFTIRQTYIFIRGKNNVRKQLYPEYKSNRPEKHILTNYLYDYLIKTFNAVESDNFEAEDFCATIGWKLKQDCIIAYCDHDLEEVSECILYNYQKDTWKIQSVKEGLYAKYYKLVIGEAGDYANFTPGIGKKYFQENFHIDMTIEEYEEATLQAFLWAWADKKKEKSKTVRTINPEKAEKMLQLAKEIIWLKNTDELEKLELTNQNQ